MRLEFYSMPFVVYSLGAMISYRFNHFFLPINYVIGYLIIFLIELLTVFTNEYYDFETDRLNKNPTRFTGGSRMLVENKISIKELKTSLIFVSMSLLILSGYLLKITISSYQVLFLLALGTIFGVSYTTPPLKFSYMGLGELDVAFIHGFYVIVCGYVFQKCILDTGIIWIIGMPIFFSSLAGVSLAGVPDLESDRLFSKKSLAVILGIKNTMFVSFVSSLITGIWSIYLYFVFFSWQFNYLYLLLPIYPISLSYIFVSRQRLKNYEIGISKMIFRSMILIALSSFTPLIIFLIN
jgi:1,4-dihydroxy-2-naphthoate octaprenyltransferase